MPPPRQESVTVYVRHDCPLCEEGLAMVQKLARWLWFTVTVVNVDDDPALAARFEYQVPVVAIGEEVLGHAPLEESALRKALAYALAPGGAAALRERESRL